MGSFLAQIHILHFAAPVGPEGPLMVQPLFSLQEIVCGDRVGNRSAPRDLLHGPQIPIVVLGRDFCIEFPFFLTPAQREQLMVLLAQVAWQ